jgi:hypothetical protein
MKKISLLFLTLIIGLIAFGQDCTHSVPPGSGAFTVQRNQVYCITEGFYGSIMVSPGGILKVCGNVRVNGSVANYGSIKVASGGSFSVYGSFLRGSIAYNQNQSCSTCEDEFETQTASICEGGSYTFFGQSLTEAGSYTHEESIGNGCTRFHTLNLEVNPTFTEEFSAEICDNEVYTWDGRTYENAGAYPHLYQTVKGCDSLVTLNLDVNPTFNEELSAEICDNEIYTWDGRTYENAGAYPHMYQTVNGCDSLVTLNLEVNPTFNDEFSAEICDNEVYTWDGRTYENAGAYPHMYQTVNGCDSLVTLNLIVNPLPNTVRIDHISGTSDQTMCSNGVAVLSGAVWDNNNEYNYQWSNGETTRDITFVPQVLDQPYTQNFSVVVSNEFCSKELSTYIDVNPTPIVDLGNDVTICDNENVTLDAGDGKYFYWNGPNDFSSNDQSVTLSDQGNYSVTVYNQFGCYASDDINVIVNPTYNEEFSAKICDNENYTWDGRTYDTAGAYPHMYQTIKGCDSLVTLNLEVNPTFNEEFSAEICDNEVYTWDGRTYEVAGSYPFMYQTVKGCDSLVTLNLEVNPTFNEEFSAEICDNEVYTWDGRTYENAGSYPFMYQTVKGCDSLVTLNLEVNPTFNEEFSVEICDNEVYTWDGRTYENAGSYPFMYQTVKGCDSLVTLNLEVNPTFNDEFSAEICDNEVYTWDGRTYENAGSYPFMYQTVKGCDSLVTLNLEVNPTYDFSIDTTICHDEVFTWNGYELNTSGSVSHTFQTVDGCDSTITFNVIQLEKYVENMGAQYLCGGDYTFSPIAAGSNYVWSTGSTASSITVQNEGNYNVNFTDENGCSAKAFGSIVQTYSTSNTLAITDNQPVHIVERFGGHWSSRTLDSRTYSSSIAVHEGFLYVSNSTINGSVVVEPDYTNNANIIACGNVTINSSNGQGFALKSGGVLKVFGTLTLNNANELNGTIIMAQGAQLIITGSTPSHGSNLNIQYVGAADCYAYVDADLSNLAWGSLQTQITTNPSLAETCSVLACPTSCGFEVKKEAYTQTEEASNEVEFEASVFPNPTNGMLQIELSNNNVQNTSIVVYDMQGKLVLNETISTVSAQLNLSHLNNGMYHVIIQNNAQVVNQKIMIQK